MPLATVTEAKTQFAANANYESDTAGTQVAAFVEACRYLVAFEEQSYSIAGRTLSRRELTSMLKTAEQWRQENGLDNRKGNRVGLIRFGRTG